MFRGPLLRWKESHALTSVVLDGATIIQMLKRRSTKVFIDYAHQVFIPYIFSQLRGTTCLDLVWGRYLPDSLKVATITKWGTGMRRRVVGTAAILSNWQNFLRVDCN